MTWKLRFCVYLVLFWVAFHNAHSDRSLFKMAPPRGLTVLSVAAAWRLPAVVGVVDATASQ
eukprot:9360932-Lingulodinium_polyedra.AAC.1